MPSSSHVAAFSRSTRFLDLFIAPNSTFLQELTICRHNVDQELIKFAKYVEVSASSAFSAVTTVLNGAFIPTLSAVLASYFRIFAFQPRWKRWSDVVMNSGGFMETAKAFRVVRAMRSDVSLVPTLGARCSGFSRVRVSECKMRSTT